MPSFSDLRIVELAGSAAGGYAGKLFADYGAAVLLIEASGGRKGAYRRGHLGDVDPVQTFLDTSKLVFELDLQAAADRERLEALVGGADVVVESSAPEPLRPLTAGFDLPRLVKTYISPLGSSGPYSRYRSNELTDEALAGHLYLNGEPHREPLVRPGHQAQYQAGVHAFIGAMAALHARRRTGSGQTVEVAHVEGLAALHQFTTVMWRQAGHVVRRVGNHQGGPWHPVGIYPCQDGYVSLAMPVTVMLQPFLDAIGLGHLLSDPRFADDFARSQYRPEFDAAILPWLLSHKAAEIVEIGQRAGSPIGPVKSFMETLADPHLEARDFWRDLGSTRRLRFPRGPFLIEDRLPDPRPPRRATSEQIAGWSQRGVDEGAPGDAAASLAAGPLDGVRILDLTRVWAGPLASRMLGDLGADVIKVEATWARGPGEVPPEAGRISHLFADEGPGKDPYNRNVSFNKLNRNKRSLTLELGTAAGKSIFERLVPQADVVLKNFSAGVMDRLGLGWSRLRELNPNVVYVAMPGFGSSGPCRDWLAFGPLIEAASGLAHRIGYRDSGPYRSGVAWPDPVASLQAVAGTLIALADQRGDPQRRGRWVEVAMMEALQCFNGDQVLETQLLGEAPPRRGNRHPERAPQGCYPCQGEDRWIAISVTSDAEWQIVEVEGLGGRERAAELLVVFSRAARLPA